MTQRKPKPLTPGFLLIRFSVRDTPANSFEQVDFRRTFNNSSPRLTVTCPNSWIIECDLLTTGARKVARSVPIHMGPASRSCGLTLRPDPVIIICPSLWLVGEFASLLCLLRSEPTVLGAPVPCQARRVKCQRSDYNLNLTCPESSSLPDSGPNLRPDPSPMTLCQA